MMILLDNLVKIKRQRFVSALRSRQMRRTTKVNQLKKREVEKKGRREIKREH